MFFGFSIENGITIVALLVTLIVLLILAAVSLSAVFSEKGIFNRAEKAGNKYNEAKAREVLETVLLADGQYEKHSNPKYNQDDFLNELIKKEIEGAEIKGDVAIIDGWAFLLDRSVPKIGEPLGRAEGLVFPTVKVSKAKLAEDYRTASFTVTAIEETNGINKIEIWLNGEKIKDLDKTYSNVKEEIEQEFTVNKNGVYTVKVYGKLMASEIVEVTGIVPAVEFTPNGNTEWKKEHQTKITVKTNETITSMKYLWTTSGTNPPEISDFNNAGICTNNSIITGGNDTMTGAYYLWVLLTIGTGEVQKTNICGSEGFNFDNEGPDFNIAYTAVGENEIDINITTTDNGSKKISIVKCVIEDNIKQENNPQNNIANINFKNIPCGRHQLICEVTDGAGNTTVKESEVRTLLHTWSVYNARYTNQFIVIAKNVRLWTITAEDLLTWYDLDIDGSEDLVLGTRYELGPQKSSKNMYVGKYTVKVDTAWSSPMGRPIGVYRPVETQWSNGRYQWICEEWEVQGIIDKMGQPQGTIQSDDRNFYEDGYNISAKYWYEYSGLT